ncbi:alkaline shock response membrane anchor protein AmaP [Furfurilactobacillus curtus]|uniref:Alkaline shock response membrane anchor protein AmaP n=1 Tax=Furfurilactobacillus curtus TaxID=1746200 RepID=A0ABQ5JV18_9LACO
MKRITKWLVSLGGIAVILLGCLTIWARIKTPWIPSWINHWIALNPEVIKIIMIGLSAIVIITGILILLVGIFKPRTVATVSFKGPRGTVSLPISALEHDLKYRIESSTNMGHVTVNLRAHNKKQKVDVSVQGIATFLEAEPFKNLGNDVLAVVKQYLHDQLDFKLRHRHIRIEPAISPHQRDTRVV